MEKQDILERFTSLLDEVKREKDEEDISVSLSVLRKAVDMLVATDTRKAMCLLECYEGALKYCNFLIEDEAEKIVSSFINYDGTKGAYWRDHDVLFETVDRLNGKTEDEPAYNKWALYATMNMVASDQGGVIAKWVGSDKEQFALACYELALSHLNDKDRECWCREYFHLCD